MWFFLFALFLCPLLHAQSAPPDAQQIIRHSVERDWTDFSSLKDYTYEERTEFRQFDKDGKLSSTRSETHDILILGNRPYEKLVARNDKPLSAAEQRKEQEKLDREAAKRQHESAGDQAKEEKERAEDWAFIREVPDAFHFQLAGTETVSGEPAWVIDAEPKPGYRPIHSKAKLLTKIRAKIWVEQQTYHWVKAEIEVLEPLTFGLGLLRVSRGGVIHFAQRRVNNEVWLPEKILVHADARLAFVKKLHAEYDIQYSGYKKFQAESRIVGSRSIE
jgi:hypothetical protein